VQLAARLVHGANSNANAIKTVHRKRISVFIRFAPKSLFLTAYERPPATASLVQ
jgi:hypothetical protein